MAYTFNLETAIDDIATLEAAITTPSPGITTAYGYGENPNVITDVSLFPAVVHVPLGPATTGVETATDAWTLHYDIYSLLLLTEAIPDKYPSDESANNLLWKSVVEKFLTRTTRSSLCTSTGAIDYVCIFQANSYGVRNWPPIAGAPNAYWSLQYTHRFSVYGG